MKRFKSLSSLALLIRTENIDTDQIIPARFLKTIKRAGLGKYLFYNWRFDNKGNKKDNYFNNLNYQSTSILIAGNNFGCGSSREHAVWALLDYGFKALISSSFGDIFYYNSLKNGLLPVVVTHKELVTLIEIVKKNPKIKIAIDLEKQELRISHPRPDRGSKQWIPAFAGMTFHFPIDPFRKTCLLKGVDELGYIHSHEQQIREFEQKHKIFISYQ